MKRYFWYLKESSVSVNNTIWGEVIYLEFLNKTDCKDSQNKVANEKSRQVQVEGFHYKRIESQIRD